MSGYMVVIMDAVAMTIDARWHMFVLGFLECVSSSVNFPLHSSLLAFCCRWLGFSHFWVVRWRHEGPILHSSVSSYVEWEMLSKRYFNSASILNLSFA